MRLTPSGCFTTGRIDDSPIIIIRDNFMTTLLDRDRVASIVRQLLSERFADTFDFGPILVEREFDHDGDEYVHVYIVFDGDQDELDPSWTSSLSGRLWPHLVEMGFDSPPSKSFIEKSEWAENPRVKAW